jgi:hypothetical protein
VTLSKWFASTRAANNPAMLPPSTTALFEDDCTFTCLLSFN